MNIRVTIALLMLTALLVTTAISMAARVITEGKTIYIVDRTGERWDVTQAKSLGFVPSRFQYGIGKNAFTPLQDKDFAAEEVNTFFNSRIIGVSSEDEAHAYSIDRLRYHEIANTTLEGAPIAVGY